MYQSIEGEKKFLAIQDSASASASAPVTADQSTRKLSESKKVTAQNLQITNHVTNPVSLKSCFWRFFVLVWLLAPLSFWCYFISLLLYILQILPVDPAHESGDMEVLLTS